MTILDRFSPIIDGIDLKTHLKNMAGWERRFVKTHELGARYMTNGKIVYLARDGRDATWSYHKYRVGRSRETPGDFDLFLDLCLNDRVRYFSWYRNVASWLAFREHPSMLLLRFEDMRADPRGTFLQVLRHLDIQIDTERVDTAVALATPDRVNASFRSEVSARWRRGDASGQGGVVERWRTVYTPSQLKLFEDKAGDVLRALGYPLSTDPV